MLIKDSPRFAFLAPGILLALMLTACGDSSTDHESYSDSAKTAERQTIAEGAPMTALPTGAIDLSTAQAPLKSASQALPECPWLSDNSANAAVDNVMTSEPMVRRAVTPDECKWNVNMGFSFSIRAVPLSEAADPGTVTYNMDSPPVLEPQDGPGSNAVAILDPTWNAEQPRPFAFVFNADDRQFKITTTGVRTSIARMRSVADEIVQALPTASPVVVAGDAVPALDPCVYEGATVAALFGGNASDAFTEVPYLPGSSCSYSGSVGNTRIDLTIGFSGDPLMPPDGMDPDYLLIQNAGADIYRKDMSPTAGFGRAARAYQIARPSGQIRVDLKVAEPDFPDAVAEALLNNLIARTDRLARQQP